MKSFNTKSLPCLTFLDSIIILISHLESSFHHIWWSEQQLLSLLDTYSKLSWRSKVERFVKIVNGWKPSTVFERSTILDFSQGSENASTFSIPLFFSMFSKTRFDHYNKNKDKVVLSNFNLRHILQKNPGFEFTKFNPIQGFIRNPTKHIQWSILQK